ncbi:hypothetical protein ACJJTC_001539 [Scirpophaga incertulas]
MRRGHEEFRLLRGDVVVLMAPNHLDLCIPFYAALYVGVVTAAIDRTFGVSELKRTFEVTQPKLIFCQSARAPYVQQALKELGSPAHIITFDNGDYTSFPEFLENFGQGADIDKFSGTTGLPKNAAVTHKNLAINTPYFLSRSFDYPSPTKKSLLVSPLQWLTTLINFLLSAVLRFTRVQSSFEMTEEHTYHIINMYRPTFVIMSPTMMTLLLKPGHRDKCDFTCLELIMLGGTAVSQSLLQDLKEVSPKAEVYDAYGASELCTLVFNVDLQAPGSCGRPIGCFQYRLVDITTQKDILVPHVPGELWVKGPGIFKGYYNNLAATKETFAEGGWFKTGDLFYRDNDWNFYFVDRAKLLLKYHNHQISPVEVEGVIRQHPGVLDVAVTGVPHPECGDLPMACVVKKVGHSVTAQEIKKLVKDNLTETKQLRGGVIFLSEMPVTPSMKINRTKLKEIAIKMAKEKEQYV